MTAATCVVPYYNCIVAYKVVHAYERKKIPLHTCVYHSIRAGRVQRASVQQARNAEAKDPQGSPFVQYAYELIHGMDTTL